MSGGREGGLAMRFILMIWSGSLPKGVVLHQLALLTNWKCGCAKVMEVFVGFYLVSIRCTTTRDRSTVGMLRLRILMSAREPKRNFSRRTLPFARRSTRLRCSRKLSAHRGL